MRLPPRAPPWKGTGQMRNPPATRDGREPLRVRVPPLPLMEAIRPDEGPVPKTGRGASPCGCESHRFLHTAVVQRTRRRALTPETRVQLSVAVLDARSSNGRTPDCYSGYGGSSPPLAAATPGGRGSRHAVATRVTQVRVLFGRPCRSDATERGSFHRATPRAMGSRAGSRRGKTRHNCPRSTRFTDRRLCGCRSRVRISERHSEDESSNLSNHTQVHTTRRG